MEYDLDTPLRLETAAKVAFPDGSMSGAALRRQIKAGRLDAEFINGKFYVTLRSIGAMREQCRVRARDLTSNSNATGTANPEMGHPRLAGEEKGTGLGTGASDEQKRQALADYLKKIHDPSPKRGGDPNQALVADCLAYYLTKRL